MSDLDDLIEEALQDPVIRAAYEKNKRERAAFAVVADIRNDPEVKDTDIFCSVVRSAQEVLALDDYEMATLFDVSVPTVQRWKAGKTFPRSVLRNHVYSVLLDHLLRDADD